MDINKCFPQIRGNAALRMRISRDITSDGGLAHAYIIEGRPGSGRRTLAVNIAAALCCERASKDAPLPCGECASCRKILAGISPDVITVARENGRASLGIDAIRALRTDVYIRPNELEYKIYIIEDADTMTAQAQNALLLTLEEPPAYLVFLLIAESSQSLLETVRSRAPSLRMQPLPPETVAEIAAERSPEAARLKLEDEAAFRGVIMSSDGSAGRAISLLSGKEKDAVTARRRTAEDFCRTAAARGHGQELLSLLLPFSSGKREDAALLLDDISLALRDLALLKKSENAPLRFFTDRDEAVDICGGYTLARIISLYDAAENARDLLSRNANTRLTVFGLMQAAEAPHR